MKRFFLTLIACLVATVSFAGNLLTEGFEYANHDLMPPVGWTSVDSSWRCGYLEKDHNRKPHNGNWYAFSDAEDAWMFMPLYFLETVRYRFILWAITDGSFQFEIWAGTAPHPDDMHTQFFSTTIDADVYDKISAYVETIPPDCHYFGFRAIALDGASHLTIDDVEIDMVEQYYFEAEAVTGDTVMYPGTQGCFRYLVNNVGYDALDVTMHPSNEYFTDFTCFANGVSGMTVHVEPNEVLEVTMTATLRPEIEPGTVSWLDIQMTIPCNCNTALVTFWVTPLEVVQTVENVAVEVNVYPNPTTNYIIVEAEGLQGVTLMDMTGKTLSSTAAEGRSVRLDVSDLKAGLYLISAKTRTTSSFVKPILKM